MASIVKKLGKNDDCYFVSGNSDTFSFEGLNSYFINNKVEYFSNDKYIVAEMEFKDGNLKTRNIGINKRYWRFNDGRI